MVSNIASPNSPSNCIHTENTDGAAAPHEDTPWANVLPDKGVLDGRGEKTHSTSEHGGLQRGSNRIFRVVTVVFGMCGHGGGWRRRRGLELIERNERSRRSGNGRGDGILDVVRSAARHRLTRPRWEASGATTILLDQMTDAPIPWSRCRSEGHSSHIPDLQLRIILISPPPKVTQLRAVNHCQACCPLEPTSIAVPAVSSSSPDSRGAPEFHRSKFASRVTLYFLPTSLHGKVSPTPTGSFELILRLA